MSTESWHGLVPNAYRGLIEKQLQDGALIDALFGPKEERERRRAEFKERRAAERAVAEEAPLALWRLIEKLGISREFAHHLCQPYCDCVVGDEGWWLCAHAYDLGIEP